MGGGVERRVMGMCRFGGFYWLACGTKEAFYKERCVTRERIIQGGQEK